MRRREFLKLVGMGGAGMLAAPGVLAAMTGKRRIRLPSKLIYDSRYANATAYANRLCDSGIPCIDTQGDLISLWHREFDSFRLRSTQAMLGYTTWSDYQALRGLLNDARLGRDSRYDHPGSPRRLVLLSPDSGRDYPEDPPIQFTSTSKQEANVYLVRWLLRSD